ncbi:MAG: DUF5123 domain-containing protein [Prevotellaceae bacterium]|jgi:hypothetical protein|nr:DUF5123 domain-containing protein [Prevotellaceae bacterium]
MKTAQKLLYMVALALALTACKEPMDEITGTDYPRTFSPIEIEVTHIRFDSARIEWQSIDGASAYTVELSGQGDSLQFSSIVRTWDNVDGTRLNVGGLWGEAQYSVRIKAKTFAEGKEDSKWKNHTWKTPAEQVFLSVRSVDIKGTSVKVRWSLPNGKLTELRVSGGIDPIQLTETDMPNGERELTGLKSNTSYTIALYDGTKKRGEVKPKTRWKPTGAEGNVVTLSIGQDLKAACEDAANVGKIIYLPDNYTFDVLNSAEDNGMLIAGSMTIMGDPDASAKPKIKFFGDAGKRCFILPANADTILITNVILEGDPAAGSGIIDQPNLSTDPKINTLKALVFENDELLNVGRGFVRLRSTTDTAVKSIESLSVNDCIFSNFGATNSNGIFINVATEKGGIDNITITNTTIYGQKMDFINASGTGTTVVNNPVKKINIENCTFDDIVKESSDNRYFIQAANNTGLTATVKNCILGKTATARQFNGGSGSTATATDCYKTSDHATTASYDFASGVTAYSGSSTTLWTNPAAGDFTFKDADFAGKATAGDPRWR